MEAALFFLDCSLMALLCWRVMRAEAPGGPRDLGFFAYEDRHVVETAGRDRGAPPRP